MITDSFHAVVFSIVYQKQFVVLRRNEDGEKGSMNSRMYSLCKMFPEIEGKIVEVDNSDSKINYHNKIQMNHRLSKLKLEAFNWLNRNLEEEIYNLKR